MLVLEGAAGLRCLRAHSTIGEEIGLDCDDVQRFVPLRYGVWALRKASASWKTDIA